MRHLLMGVAAIAMAASVAHADPGKNKGNGNGNAKNKPAAAAAIGNPGAADRQQGKRANSASNGSKSKPATARPAQASRANANGNGNGNGSGNGNGKAKVAGPPVRAQGNAKTDLRVGNGASANARDTGLLSGIATSLNLVQGCPPGLAKKRNGCQAPGQAKANEYRYLSSLFGLGDRRSSNYFYNDGYLLRSGGSGVSAWLPVLGGALAIGSEWPGGYDSRALPGYYENYFSLGGRDSYRYADRVVYRVDPETAAIRSVAALLTGDNFTVGQPMPKGYDVYNVPSAYQERYYDQPGRQYRYSDGYVYEIDPETRLVAAAIELLV